MVYQTSIHLVYLYHLLKPYLNSDTIFSFDIAIGRKTIIPAGFFTRASESGHFNILQYFEYFVPLEVPERDRYLLDSASRYCQIQCLEWWKSYLIKEKSTDRIYSAAAIDELCLERVILQTGSTVANSLFEPDHFSTVEKQLQKLDWWKKSGLEMIYTENAMDKASRHGFIEVLDWWVQSGLELRYSTDAMCSAAENGHIEVLQWWVQSDLDLQYDDWALDIASKKGHIPVLEWWKKSKLKFQYSNFAMDEAPNTDVLNWWKNSGYPLKYTQSAIHTAAYEGSIDILNWWCNLEDYEEILDFTDQDLIDIASKGNHPPVLQWLRSVSNDFFCSPNAIDDASEIGSIDSLEWWKNSGLPLQYTEWAMDWAERHCCQEEERILVLDWWKRSGLELKYTEECMHNASYDGEVGVLQWWLDSKLPLKYDEDAMDGAREIVVLDWWVNSGLPLKYTKNYTDRCQKVKEWWENSGLDK